MKTVTFIEKQRDVSVRTWWAQRELAAVSFATVLRNRGSNLVLRREDLNAARVVLSMHNTDSLLFGRRKFPLRIYNDTAPENITGL